MGRLGFYFDMTKCSGCRACQVACKDRNNLKVGQLFRKVYTYETGKFPNPGFYNFSATCNHCANAKCVSGCPTKAMHYGDDGTVQHDIDKCIGCQYCVWNCPYGAPQYLEDLGKSRKCDACKDLRDAGGNPVCVDACNMRVIEFGDLDELRAKHAGEELVSTIAVLPDESITEPSLLIKPRPCAFLDNYKQKIM